MEQIILQVETMDWTMGEYGGLGITIRKDCHAKIDWGDGHIETIKGNRAERRFQHSYRKRLPIRPYTVTITANEDEAIEAYWHGFIDMNTHSIDVSGCPGLKMLDAGGIEKLHIGTCCHIEDLKIGGDIKDNDVGGIISSSSILT